MSIWHLLQPGRQYLTWACAVQQAIISLVVAVAVLMPLGVFLTKACGGTCCGLFSCCGLTYLTVLAMKISWFFFKLPFRIWCCVRKFERDRQVHYLHSSYHSCLKLLQQALVAACIGARGNKNSRLFTCLFSSKSICLSLLFFLKVVCKANESISQQNKKGLHA